MSTKTPRILVCDRFTPESIEYLRAHTNAEIILCERQPQPEHLHNATAILIRSRTSVDKELLALTPQLKVIITATSGYDHIDLTAALAHNVVVMHTPEANAQSAAELTLFLTLAALRKATEHAQAMRAGHWKDATTPGHELRGKCFGIIGLGRVGTRVAELAQAFGAHVMAHDPYQEDDPFERLEIERSGLTEVFTQADILSFHVPLNSETRHIVRRDTIEIMQEGVVLINASRGPIFDEGALVAALESRQVSAAGLDVFEHEPLARDSRLRKMPSVVLTPHIGAHTFEAYDRASLQAAQKLTRFLLNGEISDNLPLQ